ncbi:MAG: UvrD-helicase domain-containing protein [Oscillospiraceae bacterium]
MEQAHISTEHAFCLDLIREEAHTLDLEADFRIADDNELKILLSTTVHECVEQCYERDESGEFCALAELISSGRDDSRLIKTILRLYAFVRSHPFYEDWLREKLDFYRTQGPLGATVWGKEILEYTKDAALCHGAVPAGNSAYAGGPGAAKSLFGGFPGGLSAA